MKRLHTHIIGEGIPVIVVHGWEMNGIVEATDFEPAFAVSQGLQRIYIDLPGMGKSPIDGAQDLEAIYARLHLTVLTIIDSQRFLLIGSSCGAYLCRALVHDFGSQIDGVLLRVPLIEPDNARRDIDEFRILVPNLPHMQSLSQADAKKFEDASIQTPTYLEQKRSRIELAESAMVMSDGEALAKIRNDTSKYVLNRPFDSEGDFTAPALILCGRHDGVVGYRDAWKLMEKYPHATFAVLDRAGHDLPVDEGELFTSLVRDWLKRVREYRESKGQYKSLLR